jgi:hypothetical protein
MRQERTAPDLDNGVGEFHPLQHDRLLQVTESVSRDCVLQSRQRNNVSSPSKLDVLPTAIKGEQAVSTRPRDESTLEVGVWEAALCDNFGTEEG